MKSQDIIDQLKEARKRRKLSQQALGELIGDTKSNISWIESGNRNISIDKLVEICNALGVEVKIN